MPKKSKPKKVKGGLTRWLEEKWVDVKTGKPCGRQKGESSKTPKTVAEMTASEKARFKREKTSSKKIEYQHKRKTTKKRRRKT